MNARRGHKRDNRHAEHSTVESGYYADSKLGDSSDFYICSRCGKPIKDLSAALANKPDGEPVHFDCVLQCLQQNETLQQNEAVSYIGQGRFAVIKYASMVTMKEFTIVRTIEWEDKNRRAEWRGKIANRFSQIA